MLGMFMLLPILTTYGLLLPHSNKFLVGLAIGIYGFTQAIFQIPFGLLSDKIGRKPIIIIGLLILTFGSIIGFLSKSICGVIIARALQGSGAISSVSIALLSDLVSEQNYTKSMIFLGISFGINFIIAMILGPILASILGLNGIFFLIIIFSVLGILITIFLIPNTKIYTFNRNTIIVKKSLLSVFFNKDLLKINISIFLLHMFLVSNFIALPIQLELFNFPNSRHWQVYFVTIIVSFFLMFPLLTYAEKKQKIKKIFVFGVILITLSEIILWKLNQNFWIIIIGIQLFFLSFNLIEVILPSLITKESPVGYKGTSMGIYTTSQFLGSAMGGSIGGFLFQHFDFKTVFLFNIIFGFLWILLSLKIHEPPTCKNFRIFFKDLVNNEEIVKKRLKKSPGILSYFIDLKENYIYIKANTNITNEKKTKKTILKNLKN
ncbi:major facilitator superfamily MFS_1 [Candidatus Tachikawaea gelatinosa]|uniref:Major facilitator superfamily MFS_1 n=2 Tax=Candidatus Tachikawaea gelatinosa TaxID=1410383 RepID=A0A090AJX2_9ENTR|nr:major facilitator superfamily MFS_1 [Candidatus Tachikawaea gelatinosa]